MNKRFDRRLWLNRIVFTIFKSIPKMISKALMSVSAHYEEIAVVRKCPDIITETMRLKTNISIVNSLQTPSALNLPPVPNVSADDVNYDLNIDQTHLPKTVAPDPTDNVLKHNCPFCKKFLSNSSNCRPLLFCFDCQTSDSLRAPVKIPVEVSPVSSVPVSMEMRKLADNNYETVEKLKVLHPTENICPLKPPICEYWLENPFQAQEVFNAIVKLPKGKAAGPSGISFDLLKTACKNTPEISEDLAIYFQSLMCLNYVPPPELTAARLVALVKPGKSNKPDGVRPIAIRESLTRMLSSLIFNLALKLLKVHRLPRSRGDLVVPGLNGSFTILDAMSIDPCNSSNEHLINSDVNNPLLAGEKYKIAKYAKPISSINQNSHAQYNVCPFVSSMIGSSVKFIQKKPNTLCLHIPNQPESIDEMFSLIKPTKRK
ncbi:hypothetical protein P9112_014100 [Eukaryota sp. TZLM1-RC]